MFRLGKNRKIDLRYWGKLEVNFINFPKMCTDLHILVFICALFCVIGVYIAVELISGLGGGWVKNNGCGLNCLIFLPSTEQYHKIFCNFT